MGFEKTLRQLEGDLKSLQEELTGLQFTAREDLPPSGGVILVDHLGDAVEDALGWLHEGIGFVEEAIGIVGERQHQHRLLRCFSEAQERYNKAQQIFHGEVAGHRRLKDLAAFGASRGGEWTAWVAAVEDSLDRCQAPLNAVCLTFHEGWQELTERSALNTISIASTSIGQIGT